MGQDSLLFAKPMSHPHVCPTESRTIAANAPPMPSAVADALENYPAHVRARLTEIRALIFATAERAELVGEITETTKWGEPAYLSKFGSTVRLGAPRGRPDHWAIYFNCNTSLVESFRHRWGRRLTYEGNRALIFNCTDDAPGEILQQCIETALAYQLIKKTPGGVAAHLRARP